MRKKYIKICILNMLMMFFTLWNPVYAENTETNIEISIDKRIELLASAQPVVAVDGIKYKKYADDEVLEIDEVILVGLDETQMSIVDIPESVKIDGKDYKVTAIKDYAFSYEDIIQIHIPDTIRYIGDYAFDSCDYLKEITIPNSVERIGYAPFAYCSNLKKIKLPDNITSLEGVLVYCDGLESFTIPNSVMNISGGFMGCRNLENIVIPEGITSIGNATFMLCENLKKVALPKGLKRIDKMAFYGCENLENIEIPENVEYIGEKAFSECESLQVVKIPESVTEIGVWAFYACQNLKSVELPNTSITFDLWIFEWCTEVVVYTDSIENAQALWDSDCGLKKNQLCDMKGNSWENRIQTYGSIIIGDYIIKPLKDGTAEIIAWNGLGKDVIIPDVMQDENGIQYNITKISSDVFMNTSIQSIVIPDTVKSIGHNAFQNCYSLETVKLGKGLIEIGAYAFDDCSSMTSIVIPESVEIIYSNAFAHCDKLKIIELPNGLKMIDTNAFLSCTSLEYIEIPDSVMEIGRHAFSKTDKNFTVRTNTERVAKLILDSGVDDTKILNSDGEEWDFPESTILNIGDYKIQCQDTEAQIVEWLGNEADIIVPSKLTGPDGTIYKITGIGNSAFSKYEKYINGSYQYGDNTIKSVRIEEGIAYLGNAVFLGCYSLEKVSLPDTLEAIGEECFMACTSLKELYIPDNVSSIGDNAFSGCIKLTYLFMPKKLKFLGNSFMGYSYEIAGNESCVSMEVLVMNGDAPDDLIKIGSPANSMIISVPAGAKGYDVKPWNSYRIVYREEDIPFTDVSESKWFYNAVKWAYTNGFLTGTSETTFSPNDPMTRGMLVTVLYRKEGRPIVTESNKFPDVNSKKYYASAITWASSEGLVSGYTDGRFGPEDSITREQLAKVLFLYAKYKGYDVTASADLSGFSDASKVSSYAKKYMQWTVAEGLIQGSNGKLNPQGNATRAEISAILKRFVEKYEVQ